MSTQKLQKTLEKLRYRWDFSQIFDDLLTFSLCALAMGRDEELYLETARRYSKEEMLMFSEAFANLLETYESGITPEGGWIDPLGDIFMENNSKFGAQARGQFFTPETVCTFMAQITYDHTDRELLINDPTCGSARTLIAFDRCHPSNRIKNFYVAEDLDPRCVRMAALNMFFHGMRGLVVHQNSLTMECWGGYRLWMPETGWGVQRLSKEDVLAARLEMISGREELETPSPATDSVPHVSPNVPANDNDSPVITGRNSQLRLFA